MSWCHPRIARKDLGKPQIISEQPPFLPRFEPNSFLIQADGYNVMPTCLACLLSIECSCAMLLHTPQLSSGNFIAVNQLGQKFIGEGTDSLSRAGRRALLQQYKLRFAFQWSPGFYIKHYGFDQSLVPYLRWPCQ